jgi:adenylate cyclase
MGSFGSISQTSASDLDIWICHQDDLSEQDQQRLAEKTKKMPMGIHISCGNAFLFDDAKTLP